MEKSTPIGVGYGRPWKANGVPAPKRVLVGGGEGEETEPLVRSGSHRKGGSWDKDMLEACT